MRSHASDVQVPPTVAVGGKRMTPPLLDEGADPNAAIGAATVGVGIQVADNDAVSSDESLRRTLALQGRQSHGQDFQIQVRDDRVQGAHACTGPRMRSADAATNTRLLRPDGIDINKDAHEVESFRVVIRCTFDISEQGIARPGRLSWILGQRGRSFSSPGASKRVERAVRSEEAWPIEGFSSGGGGLPSGPGAIFRTAALFTTS